MPERLADYTRQDGTRVVITYWPVPHHVTVTTSHLQYGSAEYQTLQDCSSAQARDFAEVYTRQNA